MNAEKSVSAVARAKRFTEGRCLYYGVFNHRAVDCAVRKKAQTFKVAGGEIKDGETGTGSE